MSLKSRFIGVVELPLRARQSDLRGLFRFAAMSNAVDIFLRGVRFNPACHKGVRVDLRTVKASKDLEHEFGAFVTDENEEAQAVREAMERGLDVTNDLYGVPHAI